MARRAICNSCWAWIASVFFLVAMAITARARAEDVIWGGLIVAENASKDGTPKTTAKWPAALAGREKQIYRIFGYKDLRVIGQAQQNIKTGEEDWLVPSKRFYLKVDMKYPIPNGYLLALQLYQEDKLLVEATVKLARGNPLYIRGPQVGSGQLIIALVAGGKESAWTKAHPPAAKSAASPSPSMSPPGPAGAPGPSPTDLPVPAPDAPKSAPSPATVPTS